ncbi:hypothetical protein KUG88_04560 [Rhodococcus rhodochrous]|uniref:hypothetical protein n=1 Tax=Rhodococcus TaxID=1827 RepID=UPI00110D8C44|nr:MULTISPECIES: hypothetical protein [Rhodococcus]MCB8909406.1 hypothetical protein [Rhodococcus rhodochrous]
MKKTMKATTVDLAPGQIQPEELLHALGLALEGSTYGAVQVEWKDGTTARVRAENELTQPEDPEGIKSVTASVQYDDRSELTFFISVRTGAWARANGEIARDKLTPLVTYWARLPQRSRISTVGQTTLDALANGFAVWAFALLALQMYKSITGEVNHPASTWIALSAMAIVAVTMRLAIRNTARKRAYRQPIILNRSDPLNWTLIFTAIGAIATVIALIAGFATD